MINLIFSGDFAPLIDSSAVKKNTFSELDATFLGADCHITNLECPLTLSEKQIEKIGPALKAHPDLVELLKNARVDVACLANNHVFDYGESGLQKTIHSCEQNSIATLGIVNRPDGKTSWLIKEIKGKKIGFLNYCEHEFSVRGDGEFGANGYDPIRCFYELSALRSQVDTLVVIYHGGNEYYPLPRPGLKKAFHFLVDLGADAVIGHHSHVISGYEIYKGKPLVYSLGNFFFPYKNEPKEWHLGMLCKLSLEENIGVELIPFQQCRVESEVHLLDPEAKKHFYDKVELLSSIISNNAELENRWNEFVKDKAKGYLKQISGLGFWGKVLLKIGFPLARVLPAARLRTIQNLMRCQSHAEIIASSIRNQVT
jgi:poly-gamma-glutamate synthesis protein (capsule biosynthesis protein)